jgi:hypothetical protein
LYEGSSPHAQRSCIFRAQAPASRFFFGTDFNISTATEAANQRARKSIERAAHVQFDQIFRRSLIHSVFSATLLLSITALFREPKAREDLKLGIFILIVLIYFLVSSPVYLYIFVYPS